MDNITLDVDGDTDRFAWGCLYEQVGRALDPRAAQGKSIRDEWNSSCDRLRLWQARVK